VEAAAEEAVEGALGDEGLQVGIDRQVVAGAGRFGLPPRRLPLRDVFHRGRAPLARGFDGYYLSWSLRRVR
jgi:hypothetical protein